MNCENCKYLLKNNENEKTTYQCEKDMIRDKTIINEEDIKVMRCGYFNQKIEDEQLSLF